MDDATMRFGLLMESAQAHQKFAETQLEKLRAHTDGLDGVVREQIRHTLTEELRLLTSESTRAARAFHRAGRGAFVRTAFGGILMSLICTSVPIGVMRWAVPSESQITALRARRDELAASVARLERQGGRTEWRSCGSPARLCVRIDRSAPPYGEKSDFYVVAGY